ncbi:MAG: SGNH/GDSL hydrolase family protein [Anaerolineales bacterium]
MKQEIKPLNVLIKGLLLFIIFNLIFAAWQPRLGQFSLYNSIFPGRERLPFGENSKQAYNLSLFDLDAMFASHVIAGKEKAGDEYRVIVIGDSSVWGTLLKPEETIAGQLNVANLSACGKNVHAYNLGYPTISLTKDVMLLSYGMKYDPDLVIWMTTLEAFPVEKQTASPLAANNEETLNNLASSYQLKIEATDNVAKNSWWENTIIGKQRALADLIRLQIYGVMWASTGIDQVYPTDYEHAQTEFEADESFHDFQPSTLAENQLAMNALETGFRVAGDTPMILVNEPMLISAGTNSDIRYNFFYPRWAYDSYREMMNTLTQKNNWPYVDMWNAIPANEFTNSAIHLTPAGEKMLAENLAPYLSTLCK